MDIDELKEKIKSAQKELDFLTSKIDNIRRIFNLQGKYFVDEYNGIYIHVESVGLIDGNNCDPIIYSSIYEVVRDDMNQVKELHAKKLDARSYIRSKFATCKMIEISEEDYYRSLQDYQAKMISCLKEKMIDTNTFE